MFFKNLSLYRLPAGWNMTPAALEEALKSQSFTPASSNELMRQGWDAPRPGGGLVHVVGKQMLIMLRTEKKLLPTSVINAVTKERAAEVEEAQGFAPGKKAMKELKERVADELLPRAFSVPSTTFAWIDPVAGWLVVDAASATKADDVLKFLLKSVDRLPVESVRVARSPVAVMTEWLQADEAPAGFTIDMDATLRATGESKAQVAYKRALDPADVRDHIAKGKQVTRLAMTWDSKISFVLTENLTIKTVRALDVLEERETGYANADERFDGDFALMTGELAKMLDDIMEALGGEVGDLVSPAREKAARPAPASMERSITLTAQLYSSRAAVRHQLGDDFHDKMADIGADIQAVMDAQNLGVLEAAMAICKRTPSMQSNLYVMAAAVEMVEPSGVAA